MVCEPPTFLSSFRLLLLKGKNDCLFTTIFGHIYIFLLKDQCRQENSYWKFRRCKRRENKSRFSYRKASLLPGGGGHGEGTVKVHREDDPVTSAPSCVSAGSNYPALPS